MTEQRMTISAAGLRSWIADRLVREKMPAEHADLAAQGLVDANLRGIDTHGVKQLPSYIALARQDGLRVKPAIRMDFNGSMIIVKADRGFGHVVGTLAIDRAIEVARHQGCAIGTIHEIGHLGALGYYTRRAAAAGMAAMLFQNGPPLMGLPGATRRAIGNNPLAFAAPAAGRAPVVFDMAASEASFGKIIEAREHGAELPAGWALDPAGAPTSDPRAAMDGILLPIAGAKGIGLAMMVQCFAGSMSGTVPVWGQGLFGAFFMIVNPAAMIGAKAFAAHMDDWLTHYAGSAPNGRIPGERADACHAERLATGIPLAPALLDLLRADGAAAGVPFPEPG